MLVGKSWKLLTFRYDACDKIVIKFSWKPLFRKSRRRWLQWSKSSQLVISFVRAFKNLCRGYSSSKFP
ncbi:unnamed protein product [Heterobilharzia americana]|nr:unnamed protein product [Heterobilharzia americana]CAH8661849.1 unnamed protein product [Heterobilharzia americana]